MQRRGFLKAGGSILLTYLSSQSHARANKPASKPQPKDKLTAELERLIPSVMHEQRIPGASLALIRDGSLYWARGFGLRSASAKDAVDKHTIFEAASVSKTVFAYAILKLCDKGTLALDTPLSKYVPWRFVENDPRLDRITARHILSHSSGLQDWRSSADPLKIHFNPGEKFLYSGEGYFYLQSVLTHLTGRIDRTQCDKYEAGFEVCATDFNDYMQRNLLRPFGMTNSAFQWSERTAKRTAFGHDATSKPKRPAHTRGSDTARYGSAGGLLTTAHDYAQFLLELLTPRPPDDFRLTSDLRNEMLRAQVKLASDQLIDGATSWALGWGVQERADGNYLVHSGGQPGFRSLAMASPKNRSAFALFTNSDNGEKLTYHLPLLELLDKVLTRKS
ncbi:MAG TPA: serine hydrolase domain-containing protein [Verrucomicrobiae bacterium]